MDTSQPPASPATRPRSAQDKTIEAYIADSKKFLKIAAEDTGFRRL